MPYLILIRHGQTDFNVKKLFSGKTNIPLNQTGIAEAKNAAKKIAHITVDVGYCSALDRTKTTLAHALSNNTKPVIVKESESLNERDYGEFEGKRKEDVLEKYGEDMLHKIRRSWDHDIPGGETLKDVSDRVVPYYENVIKQDLLSDQNVLISGHNNTLRALIKHIESISNEDVSSLELKNAEVIIYETDALGAVLSKTSL